MKSRYEKFRVFHQENPGVFELFTKFARQAKYKGGRTYYGAHMIGERIRWYTSIETTSDDEFKVNDHHWPYYARLLMGVYPDEFTNFFRRRDTRFDIDDITLLEECGL